mgnify:CR=1 FL=1
MKADSPQVRVQNVSKSYTKGPEVIPVLEDASFTIFSGDMISITGKSGAGKSTLLHVLGTLDTPDSGNIFYEGESLIDLSAAELADFRNRKLGFVFQFHHLLPEFSAHENVMMPALIRRIPKAQAEEMANKAVQEVGLGHRLGHKPGELSGGEQQRIALARALVLDPPLLLADEVTGNLDAKTGGEIHELLQSLNQTRGITIVVVTHNRILAEKMDRRLVLEKGSVKEQ